MLNFLSVIMNYFITLNIYYNLKYLSFELNGINVILNYVYFDKKIILALVNLLSVNVRFEILIFNVFKIRLFSVIMNSFTILNIYNILNSFMFKSIKFIEIVTYIYFKMKLILLIINLLDGMSAGSLEFCEHLFSGGSRL